MTSTLLVLGGARSGKSAWAEQAAAARGRPVLYVATARAGDEEMAARIAAHRARRPAHWRTAEAPDDPAAAVRASARPEDVVLLDCLSLWVSNRVLARIGEAEPDAVPEDVWRGLEDDLADATNRLINTARDIHVDLILVSAEVGLGVVPPYRLGRRYRDVLGRVNQIAAAGADAVVLVLAGIAVDLRRLALDPGTALAGGAVGG